MEIKYKDVIRLGFTEQICPDPVYEDIHGFPYAIIEKKLMKRLRLAWDKETKYCYMYRTQNGDIKAKMEIKTLKQLEEICAFFDDQIPYDTSTMYTAA